jgi:imidazolonepropionase-like amidohydrolase
MTDDLTLPSRGSRAFFVAVVAIGAVGFAIRAAADTFVVRDVRVFDGKVMLAHKSVYVRDGRIEALADRDFRIPPGAQIISGVGRTLLPGFIDAHVHVSPQKPEAALRQALWFGVTTELDMFTAQGLEATRLKAGESLDLADIRSAGIGATAPGGHPSEFGGPPFPTIGNPEEAQAFVDARLAEGSDYIKIIYDDCTEYGADIPHCPSISRETLNALVRAAHRRGKLAVVHIGSEAQARDAIEAGADGLAHIFLGATASPDFGKLAAKHGTFVIPTLSVMYWWCGRSSGPRLAEDPKVKPGILPDFAYSLKIPAVKNQPSCTGTDMAVRQLLQESVPILAGTDAPAPGTAYGASIHDELQLLVRDGLTPMQALTAATSAPAKAFHLSDRGVIRRGARADLLLVTGDPSQSISATNDIVAVWRQGRPLDRH